MVSRIRTCDWCTVKMAREASELEIFVDGEAEYCCCSKECKQKMRACLRKPKTINQTLRRWSARNYAMRSSLVFERRNIC